MLTILIPTINRYEFLNRLLGYYALKSNIMNSNDFKIFVLDSSDPNLGLQTGQKMTRYTSVLLGEAFLDVTSFSTFLSYKLLR